MVTVTVHLIYEYLWGVFEHIMYSVILNVCMIMNALQHLASFHEYVKFA